MDWTPGNMLQAEDRAHRVGQKNNVTVTILVAQDEFDEMLWGMINEKFKTVKSILDGENIEFSSTSIFSEMRKHFMKKLGVTETEEGYVEFEDGFLDKFQDTVEEFIDEIKSIKE